MITPRKTDRKIVINSQPILKYNPLAIAGQGKIMGNLGSRIRIKTQYITNPQLSPPISTKT
jgi:hypothetical protein